MSLAFSFSRADWAESTPTEGSERLMHSGLRRRRSIRGLPRFRHQRARRRDSNLVRDGTESGHVARGRRRDGANLTHSRSRCFRKAGTDRSGGLPDVPGDRCTAEVCGFFERDERNPRSVRVIRNAQSGRSSSENCQINHRNLVKSKSIAGVKRLRDTSDSRNGRPDATKAHCDRAGSISALPVRSRDSSMTSQ
jgi:hypothetical protein